MDNNTNLQNSSLAESQQSHIAAQINAYLNQQLANENFPTHQKNLNQYVQKEQGDSFLKNYVNNVCETILKDSRKDLNFDANELKSFFDAEGRNEVIAYLKATNMDFDNDEIKKISELVEKIENSAVQRFLKHQTREKKLQEENETAKQRLKSNAQNSVCNLTNAKSFTREQIGKMSSAEFAKNEKLIMEQLRQGLIK